jgi:hypothetical protein
LHLLWARFGNAVRWIDHMQLSKPETGRQLAGTIGVHQPALRDLRVMPVCVSIVLRWKCFHSISTLRNGRKHAAKTCFLNATSPSPFSGSLLVAYSGISHGGNRQPSGSRPSMKMPPEGGILW